MHHQERYHYDNESSNSRHNDYERTPYRGRGSYKRGHNYDDNYSSRYGPGYDVDTGYRRDYEYNGHASRGGSHRGRPDHEYYEDDWYQERQRTQRRPYENSRGTHWREEGSRGRQQQMRGLRRQVGPGGLGGSREYETDEYDGDSHSRTTATNRSGNYVESRTTAPNRSGDYVESNTTATNRSGNNVESSNTAANRSGNYVASVITAPNRLGNNVVSNSSATNNSLIHVDVSRSGLQNNVGPNKEATYAVSSSTDCNNLARNYSTSGARDSTAAQYQNPNPELPVAFEDLLASHKEKSAKSSKLKSLLSGLKEAVASTYPDRIGTSAERRPDPAIVVSCRPRTRDPAIVLASSQSDCGNEEVDIQNNIDHPETIDLTAVENSPHTTHEKSQAVPFVFGAKEHTGDAGSNLSSQTESEDDSQRNIPVSPRWYYRDYNNEIQGPFEDKMMSVWYRSNFFSSNLLIRRDCDPEFVPLGIYEKLFRNSIFDPGAQHPPLAAPPATPALPAQPPLTNIPGQRQVNPLAALLSAPHVQQARMALQQQLAQNRMPMPSLPLLRHPAMFQSPPPVASHPFYAQPGLPVADNLMGQPWTQHLAQAGQIASSTNAVVDNHRMTDWTGKDAELRRKEEDLAAKRKQFEEDMAKYQEQRAQNLLLTSNEPVVDVMDNVVEVEQHNNSAALDYSVAETGVAMTSLEERFDDLEVCSGGVVEEVEDQKDDMVCIGNAPLRELNDLTWAQGGGRGKQLTEREIKADLYRKYREKQLERENLWIEEYSGSNEYEMDPYDATQEAAVGEPLNVHSWSQLMERRSSHEIIVEPTSQHEQGQCPVGGDFDPSLSSASGVSGRSLSGESVPVYKEVKSTSMSAERQPTSLYEPAPTLSGLSEPGVWGSAVLSGPSSIHETATPSSATIHNQIAATRSIWNMDFVSPTKDETKQDKMEKNTKKVERNASTPADPTEDLIEWCREELSGVGVPGDLDLPTFVVVLRDLEAAYEVEEYAWHYLGKSAQVDAFVEGFIERRRIFRQTEETLAKETNSAWSQAKQTVKKKGKKKGHQKHGK